MSDEKEMQDLMNMPLTIRHMGYSALTRTKRADRFGHRKKRVSLDNGRKLRSNRNHSVTLGDFVKNHQKLLEHVRVGNIMVSDPKSGKQIAYADLLKMVTELGVTFNIKFNDSGVQQDPVALGRHEDPIMSALEDDEDDEDEPEDTQDVTDEAPITPPTESAPEPVMEAPEDPAPEEVPSAQAESTADEVTLTEEDLKKMPMKEVRAIAAQFGIEAAKMSKEKLVEAIMAKVTEKGE